MAASKSLFDVQYHINSRFRLPRPPGYDAAPLEMAIRGLGGCGRGTRYLVGHHLLHPAMALTDGERTAVHEVLLAAAEFGTAAPSDALGAPGGLLEAASDVTTATTADNATTAAWAAWDPHTEMTHDQNGTRASVWLRTNAPLAALAPKIDPQEWDTIGPDSFIEEAYGIDAASACEAEHQRVTLDPAGYYDQRLHELVRSRIPGFNEPLSCDLKVSFGRKFGAPQANFATYELLCSHQGFVNVNEGICYVMEAPAPAESPAAPGVPGPHRLLFVRKAVAFTPAAPALLKALAPILLPAWLMAMLVAAVNEVLVVPAARRPR